MISSNAIIRDVLPTLAKPEEYVCGVLEKLLQCRKKHGNAKVVIGTSGTGQKPYYRIVYDTADGEKVDDTYFDNHTSFTQEGRKNEGGVTWSIKSMALEDVAMLRGEIRRR